MMRPGRTFENLLLKIFFFVYVTKETIKKKFPIQINTLVTFSNPSQKAVKAKRKKEKKKSRSCKVALRHSLSVKVRFFPLEGFSGEKPRGRVREILWFSFILFFFYFPADCDVMTQSLAVSLSFPPTGRSEEQRF